MHSSLNSKNVGESSVGLKIVNIDAFSSAETPLTAQLPPGSERITHPERILQTYLFDFFTRSERLRNKGVTFNSFNFLHSLHLLDQGGLVYKEKVSCQDTLV